MGEKAHVRGVRRLSGGSASIASLTRPTMCRVYTLITMCEIDKQRAPLGCRLLCRIAKHAVCCCCSSSDGHACGALTILVLCVGLQNTTMRYMRVCVYAKNCMWWITRLVDR